MKANFPFERRAERYRYKKSQGRYGVSSAYRRAERRHETTLIRPRFVHVSCTIGMRQDPNTKMVVAVKQSHGTTFNAGRNLAKRKKVGTVGKANYHH